MKRCQLKSLFSIKTNQRKVLIIKLGGIGDIIMALPLLSSLDREDKVIWVCDHAAVSLLRCVPQIDQIISLDHGKILRGSFLQKVTEVIYLWWKLMFHSLDKIILAHADARYQRLTWLKRAKYFLSLSAPFKIVPYRYMAYEYLRLAKGELSKEDRWIFPKMAFPSCKVNEKYDVILAPGGNPSIEPGKNLRAWPIENYSQLAKSLLLEGKKIAIVGSPLDQHLEKYFPSEVASYIGMFDLGQLVDFYRNSKVLVTHDSGPMHLGILAGISVIALFGPTVPMEKVPPYVSVIWGGENLPCRPCYDGKNYAPCKNPSCMKQITPERVYMEIRKII